MATVKLRAILVLLLFSQYSFSQVMESSGQSLETIIDTSDTTSDKAEDSWLGMGYMNSFLSKLFGPAYRDDFPCPEAASIAPCNCTYDESKNVDLDCTGVESEDQLASVFLQEFPVKDLREFFMYENTEIKMLRNILNGVTFQRVNLFPGPFTLEGISEYFFLDMKDTLNYVSIVKSNLSSDLFPFATLSVMNNLSILNVRESDLTWIPRIDAQALQSIQFSSGFTSVIESGTFPVGSGMLEVLLDDNEIATVEPGSFLLVDGNSVSSNQSTMINLQQNQLQALLAGTFPFREGSMVLFLANNQIASIEAGTFVLPPTTGDAGEGQIYIDLGSNRLQSLQAGTFPLRQGPVSLHLMENQITAIEPGAFALPQSSANSSNEHIYISLYSNLLETLQEGTFPFRDGPMTVLLYSNNITFIEPGTFVMPQTTEHFSVYLLVNNNQLTSVQEDVFGALLPYATELGLSGNPLSCGCDLAWLVLDADILGRVDDGATCANGTNIHSLDAAAYADLC